MILDKYSLLKEEILKSIDSMTAIESIPGCPCEELKDKLQNNVFNLVVLGQFKRGKTTLINALLAAEILPTAIVPLTSIATIVKYGEALRIKVYFNDGRVTEIKPESLPQYVTEKGNPKNEKDVREVVITYPSPYLKDGVRLIDTPGVGSVYQHNTDVAYQYLPKSDAAIFLLSVDQPVGQAEIEFLKDVKEYSHRIFFLQNKADYVSAEDLNESISFTKRILEEYMGWGVKMFPLSAKLALDGKLSGSRDLLEKSFLPEFEKILNRFLMEEKGKVLLLSVSNTLLRVLSQAMFELELEMKSLTTPLDELKVKIEAFEKKKKEVLREKQDFDILLEGEVNRLVNKGLDEDQQEFKKELTSILTEGVKSFYKEKQSLPSRQLNSALEEYAIDEVRNAYNNWWAKEDGKLASAFESICGRFIVKINEIVDALLKFSSELFDIPFEEFKAEELWTVKPSFYYKFKEEPVVLEVLATTFTLSLPKFIGDRILLRKTKEYMVEMVDMQGGRVRYDFVKRLDKSKLDFRWEMLKRIEATIEGISTAIEKGMSQKSKGEKAVEERKQVLLEAEQKMNEIKGNLVKMRQQVIE
ncbi:MAG: dynamin family protein [Thermodesulfovibrionales bacterium]|nr:dynamin family protein [Thermodesulfovibrionales bacterium]